MLRQPHTRQGKSHALTLSAWVCLGLGLPPCAFGQAPSTDPSPAQSPLHSVAFCYFTSTSPSYGENLQAQQLAELVQSTLIASDVVSWVERADIDAALRELEITATTPAAADDQAILCLGRWLRADMLIKGVVSPVGENKSRLTFEVIDLERADVLDSNSIDFRIRAAGESIVTAANGNRAAAAIGRSLTKSLRVRQQLPNQVLVAPLYFANAHSTGRLDFFEADLQQQFAQRNARQRRVRFLQFPRSSDSIEESNLIASGIVNADLGNWERVADYYVWGSFAEVDSSGVPFEDVQVELSISVWDGKGLVTRLADRATVRELPSLANRAVAAIDAKTKAIADESVDEGLRREIAADLATRAKDLQERVIQVDLGDFGRPSDEWLRLWQQSIRILSVAAFFDPTNETFRRELLIETTRDDLPFHALPGNHEFRRLLSRSDDWKSHCDQFGYEYRHLQSPRLVHRPGLSDNRLASPTALMEFVDTAEDAMKAAYRKPRRNSQAAAPPADAPADLVLQWQRDLTREYVDRLNFAIERSPETIGPFARQYLRNCLTGIRLDDLRAETIESLWPLLIKDPNFQLGPDEPFVRKTFATLGKSDVADRLLSQTSGQTVSIHPAQPAGVREPPPPPFDSAAPSTVQIAPLARAPLRAISLDKHFYPQSVTSVEFADDRLWIGLEGQARSLAQGYALFICNADGRDVQRVSPIGNSNAEIAAMSQDGQRMWLALDGDGVVQLDTRTTKKVAEFTQRDGLPSHKMCAIAQCGDLVYLGGGQEERGALGLFDRKTGKWSQLALPERETGPEPRNVAQITTLAGDSQWLALFAHFGGSFTSILVKRHTDQRWIDVGDRFRIAHPEFSRFPGTWRPNLNAMLWHDGILWLATSRGLAAYDPRTDQFPTALPIDLELTAIAQVGNRIWLSANPFIPDTESGSNTEGACLLAFNPTTRTWESQIPLPFLGKISAMTEHAGTLYCGMASKGATVVAVDIASIVPPTPHGKRD